MTNKSLNESIISIRVELQNAKLKKSGKNKYAGFDYFELADFLPKLNELMLKEGVNDRFYIKDGYAVLELQKFGETNTYTMPFVLFDTPVNKKYNKDLDEYFDVKSMQDIQYLGALNTYYKRYLYLNAFGITDGDVIDSMDNDDLESVPKQEKKTVQVTNITPNQLELIKRLSVEQQVKILTKYNVDTLDKLTVAQASELIANMKGDKK